MTSCDNDIAAWKYSDNVLIGMCLWRAFSLMLTTSFVAAALSVWTAFAYNHFRPHAKRHYQKDATGEELPDFIDFTYTGIDGHGAL